jgi:hypothetical protein
MIPLYGFASINPDDTRPDPDEESLLMEGDGVDLDSFHLDKPCTECADAPTESRLHVGVVIDPTHGAVPENTTDVRDFVKAMDQLDVTTSFDENGKSIIGESDGIEVEVEFKGDQASPALVGDMLASAAGTRAKGGHKADVTYDVLEERPGTTLYRFRWV